MHSCQSKKWDLRNGPQALTAKIRAVLPRHSQIRHRQEGQSFEILLFKNFPYFFKPKPPLATKFKPFPEGDLDEYQYLTYTLNCEWKLV